MTKINVTRSTELSKEETGIIWQALNAGLDGKGNDFGRLRKIDPIMNALEEQGKEVDGGGVEFSEKTKLEMTDPQWALVKTALARSSGWVGRSRKIMIPLADKLEDLPLLKKEEKPEPVKETVPA